MEENILYTSSQPNGSTMSRSIVLNTRMFYDEQNRRCRLDCDSQVFTISTIGDGTNESQSIAHIATDDVLGISTIPYKECVVSFQEAESEDTVICFHLFEKKCAVQNQNISTRERRDVYFRQIDDVTKQNDMERACGTTWQLDSRQFTSHDTEKRLLVIINPHSGARTAPAIFSDTVAPILKAAGIQYDHVMTSHTGHAEEIVMGTNMSTYYAIGVLSGDGLVHEVFNGLTNRQDWMTAMRIPIGVLPGGTFNSLAAVIAQLSGENYADRTAMPLTSSYIVAKQNRLRPVDAIWIETAAWRKYGFLGSATCGLVRDITIAHEYVRWMPLLMRMALLILGKIAAKTLYRGKLEYLPDTKEHRNLYFADAEDTVVDPNSRIILPPLDQPLPSNWCSIEDDFVSVDVVSCYHGKPEAVHDGGLHLSLITGSATRWNIVKFFSMIMTPNPEVMPLPGILEMDILAYRLTLATPTRDFAIDGELARSEKPQSIIQGEIRPTTFRLLSR